MRPLMRVFISAWRFYGGARRRRVARHYPPPPSPPTAVWERFVLLSLPAAWHGLLSGKLSQFPLIRLQAPFFFNPVHFPDKRVHIQLASHTKFKIFFLAKALWYLTPHFTANQIGAMQLRCSTVSIETSSVMTGEKGWGLGGAGSPLQRVEWLKPLWMLTVQKNNMPWFGKAQCCNYFLNVRRTHS